MNSFDRASQLETLQQNPLSLTQIPESQRTAVLCRAALYHPSLTQEQQAQIRQWIPEGLDLSYTPSRTVLGYALREEEYQRLLNGEKLLLNHLYNPVDCCYYSAYVSVNPTFGSYRTEMAEPQ